MIHKKAFNKTAISWLFLAALSFSASTAFSQQAGKEKETETTASISPSKLTIETDETDLNGDGKPDIVFKKYLRAGSSIMERIDQADGIIIYQIMRNNQMVLFLNYTPKSKGYTVSFTPGLTCRIDINRYRFLSLRLVVINWCCLRVILGISLVVLFAHASSACVTVNIQ